MAEPPLLYYLDRASGAVLATGDDARKLTDAERDTQYSPLNYAFESGDYRRNRKPDVDEGVTDEALELSAAARSCAGKVLRLKKGRYRLKGYFELATGGLTIQGEGPETILTFGGQWIAPTGLDNITFRDLAIVADAAAIGTKVAGFYFTSCSDIRFERVRFNNTVSGVNGSSTALWFKGCDGIWIIDCRFYNCEYAVYLDAQSGVPCSRAIVRGSHFEHNVLSTSAFPAQIYQFHCQDLLVDGCTFRNIYPGAPGTGYDVYEGDGSAVSLKVINCHAFNSDVGERAGPSTHANAQFAASFLVQGCTQSNDTGVFNIFAAGGATVSTTIIGNPYIKNSYIQLQGVGTGEAVTVTDNTLFNSVGAGAIRIGANSIGFNTAIIARNTILTATGSGVFINVVNIWAEVIDNVIIDVNTIDSGYAAGTNEFAVAGIAFYGPTAGIVARNYVANTNGGPGHAKYAFASAASQHNISVRPDNTFLRMETDAVVNALSSSARPGVHPFYQRGWIEWYPNLATGAAPGEGCIDNRRTTISSTEAGGQTVISVTSITGMASGDYVAILLDSGAYHYTTINGAPSGGTITILAALPSQAAAGREVLTNRFRTLAVMA